MGRLDEIAKRNRANMGRRGAGLFTTKQIKWIWIGLVGLMAVAFIGMMVQAYNQKHAEEQHLDEASAAAAAPDNSCQENGWKLDRVEVALEPVRKLPPATAIDAYCAALRPAIAKATATYGVQPLRRNLEQFARACESITVGDSQEAITRAIADAREQVRGWCAN